MSLISSIIGSAQTSKAVSAETGALGQAINSTNQLYGSASSLLQPYTSLGTTGVNSLTAALAPGGNLTQQFSFDPTQVAQDPGYQFALQQGTGAVQKAAAATGTLNSGGTQRSLAQYATGLASQYENQDYLQALNSFNTNRTANLQNYTLPIGIGQQAATQTANLDVSKSNTLNDLLTSIGTVNAAGSTKQGQIWGNFTNGGGVTNAAKGVWNAIPGNNTLTQAIGSVLGL